MPDWYGVPGIPVARLSLWHDSLAPSLAAFEKVFGSGTNIALHNCQNCLITLPRNVDRQSNVLGYPYESAVEEVNAATVSLSKACTSAVTSAEV
jgi:hypothetical protein